jgi:hypothetical protein
MYGEGRTHLVHSQPVWIGKLSPRERQGVLRVTQEAQTELGTKLEPPASKTWALSVTDGPSRNPGVGDQEWCALGARRGSLLSYRQLWIVAWPTGLTSSIFHTLLPYSAV